MGSSGGGGGTSTSTSTYSPPASVAKAYEAMTPQATVLAQTPYPDYTPGAASAAMGYNPYLVAPQTPNQIAAGQNIADLAGYYQPYANAATQYQIQGATPIRTQQFGQNAINQYMSPYLQNVMGSTIANINETNAQQQQQLQSNAISRGAFGGDRAGIAQAELARQQNLANNATLANIANTGYNTALGEFNAQNQLALQRQAANNQLAQSAGANIANIGQIGQVQALQQANAQYNIGAQQQQQQQAQLSTAYQNFLNKQAYPYQQLGWLSGIISGVASGSGGTSSGSQTAPGASGINQALGGLGALGSLGNMTGAFGSGGWASNAFGVGGIFGPSMAEAAFAGSAAVDPAVMAMYGVMGLKEGGRVEHRDHYDIGGVVGDQRQGISPIAGMAAQQIIPTAPQAMANPHVPQLSFAQPRQGGIDQTALKSAVSGIRSMLGKGDDQQKAHGGAVHHYDLGGVATAPAAGATHDMTVHDPAPSQGSPNLSNSLAQLRQSQAHYTESLPKGGAVQKPSVAENKGMQPGDAYNAYQGLAASGHANLSDLNKAYANYQGSFANVAPTDIINHFMETYAQQKAAADAAAAKAAADAAAAAQNPWESSGGWGQPGDGGSCCFTPDALILMADGSQKPIIDVVVGDKVANSEGGHNTVVKLKSTTVGQRKMVKFDGRSFCVTDDHLFLTDKGWRTFNPARVIDGKYENAVYLEGDYGSKPIQPGDVLIAVKNTEKNNTLLIPISFEFYDFDPDYTVYDLHLDGDHTYVVEGFVVHNCGDGGSGLAKGGRIHGYAQGGITNYGGLLTSKQMQDYAENIAGSGLSGVPGTIEALAAKDILPQESARGGVIRALADGGPSDSGGVVAQEDPMDRYARAIASNESGGRYNAIGPQTKTGDRAYGKYQVMGANVPTWTEEALGQRMTPAEFLNDTNAQEKVFRHKFGSYLNQYGTPQDAASMWFSGKPLAEAGGRSDVTGTTVPGYVSRFINAMDSTPKGQEYLRQINMTGKTMPQQGMGGQGQAPQSKNLFGMSDDANYALLMASLRMMGTPGNVGMGLAAGADTFAKTLSEQRKLAREQLATESEAELRKEQATSQRVSQKGLTTQVRTTGPDGQVRIENQIVTPGSSATFGGAGAGTSAAGAPQVAVPGAPATGGATGAPEAPQAPASPAQAQQNTYLGPSMGEQDQNKFAVLQQLGQEALKTNAMNPELAQSKSMEESSAARGAAVAAQNSRTDLSSTIKAVSELGPGGFTGYGPATEYRRKMAEYLNMGARSVGLPSDTFNEQMIANGQVLDKIRTLQSNVQGGSHAAVWLRSLKESYPSTEQTESGAKMLTAHMMVANQQNLDLGRVAGEYSKASYNHGTDLANAFEKVNPSGLYATAKNELANLMINNSVKYMKDGREFNANPVSLLAMGEITPEQFNKIAKQQGARINNLSRFVPNPYER